MDYYVRIEYKNKDWEYKYFWDKKEEAENYAKKIKNLKQVDDVVMVKSYRPTRMDFY